MLDIVRAWRVNGDTILSNGIGRLVVMLASLGMHAGAATLYGAATREIQIDSVVAGLDDVIAELRSTMGTTTFDSARSGGAALSYQAAADLATELIVTARRALASNREDAGG
jgi:hypothetical protein